MRDLANTQGRFLRPSLTCYALSLHDLGAAPAEGLLVEMFPDQTMAKERMHRIWPMTIVEGGSDQPTA